MVFDRTTSCSKETPQALILGLGNYMGKRTTTATTTATAAAATTDTEREPFVLAASTHLCGSGHIWRQWLILRESIN